MEPFCTQFQASDIRWVISSFNNKHKLIQKHGLKANFNKCNNANTREFKGLHFWFNTWRRDLAPQIDGNNTICWQKEGSQVILNDDQALMKTKCSIMQMLSCKIK